LVASVNRQQHIDYQVNEKLISPSPSSSLSYDTKRNPIAAYDSSIFKQLRYLRSSAKVTRQETRRKKSLKTTPAATTTLQETPTTKAKTRKRHRSSSSSFSSTRSSKSSVSSNSDTGTRVKNASSHPHKTSYYINSAHANKFDINNIVIPYEMMSNSISSVKTQNVATPKWRESNLEADTCVEHNETSNEILDDEEFTKRHEFYELKERYATLYKKLEREKQEKGKLQQHSTNLIEANKPTSKNADLEQFKKLVLLLESDKRDKRLLHQVSQLSASLPSSVLSLYLNGKNRSKNTTTVSKKTKGPSSSGTRDENNNNNDCYFLYDKQNKLDVDCKSITFLYFSFL
jgi:hypothetical protein